jgi:hypothetical protein
MEMKSALEEQISQHREQHQKQVHPKAIFVPFYTEFAFKSPENCPKIGLRS